MFVGKKTRALADSDDVRETERDAIRAALQPALHQLRHDLALVERALAAPDAEFALSLFLDAVGDVPGQMKGLEAALEVSTPLRLVA